MAYARKGVGLWRGPGFQLCSYRHHYTLQRSIQDSFERISWNFEHKNAMYLHGSNAQDVYPMFEMLHPSRKSLREGQLHPKNCSCRIR